MRVGVRFYQQTKNTKTGLFTKSNNEYAMMSLNALKNECRKRGIKVSGRKIELVNRLVSNDKGNAQGFHTKGAKKSKLQDFVKTNQLEVQPTRRNISHSGPKLIPNNVDSVKLPDLEKTDPIDTPVNVLQLTSEHENPPKQSLFDKEQVVVVNDDQPISSSAPITKNADLTLEPENKPSSPSSFVRISTPYLNQAKAIFSDFNRSQVKQQGKYEYEEFNLPEHEKNVLRGLFGGVVLFWIGMNWVESDKK